MSPVLNRLLRDAGVDLIEIPGWERGRGSAVNKTFTPVGVMWHHTACRPPGCEQAIISNNLANFVGRRNGTGVLVTAKRAYHAGWGWMHQKDRIEAGLPPQLPTQHGTGWGNKWFYGIEIDYAPQPPYSEAMTSAQYETALRITVALLRLLGRGAHAVLSHREWTTRKGDPGRPRTGGWGPIDMDPVRAEVAIRLGQPVPIPGDEDMLRRGDTGDDVKVLQRRLITAGYKGPNGAVLDVDGKYGPATAFAVAIAQTDAGYSINGDACRDALLADLGVPVNGQHQHTFIVPAQTITT